MADYNIPDDVKDLFNTAFAGANRSAVISGLTGKRKLLALAWLFAGFGLLMGVAGLMGLPLHPTALVKFLS